jgi:hypothetical protein
MNSKEFKLPIFRIECGVEEKVIAICKHTGKQFNDYSNKSGLLTKHFKENFPDIIVPMGNRQIKIFYIKNNKFWFEDYFDFEKVKIKKEKGINPKKRIFTEKETKEIIEIYKKGEVGGRVIGGMYNCSKVLIMNLLKENNIEIFSHGQRFKGGKKESYKRNYHKRAEKTKDYKQEYYFNNKERLKKYHDEWRKNNEKYKEYVRKKNNERLLNPHYKLHRRFSTSIYTSLKERGFNKDSSCFDLVPYDKWQLIKHLEDLFEDGMSWENYGDWHLEHILPISCFKVKEKGDEEFLKCWSLQNLKPLWSKENLSKGKNYDLQLKKYYDLSFNKQLELFDINLIKFKEISSIEYDNFVDINCWYNLKNEDLIYYGFFIDDKLLGVCSIVTNFNLENKSSNRIFNFCVDWQIKNKIKFTHKMFDLLFDYYGNICYLYCNYTFIDKEYFKDFSFIVFNKPIRNKSKIISCFESKDDDMINLIYNHYYDTGHFTVYYK